MTRRSIPILSGLCLLLLPLPQVVSAQDAREPLPVQIVVGHAVTDERQLTLVGEIVARDLVSVSFPASGRIVELAAERGDHVSEGTVLGRLDSAIQQQALRSAEAALDTARANARKAEEDAARQGELLTRGATTQSARDTAIDDLRAARAVVAQAEAHLDRARQALDDMVLRAPADATVTEKLANTGQVIANAQTVLELARENRYDAVFQLPETLLATEPDARPSQVALTPLDAPENVTVGTIRLISPLVDATLGTIKVTVTMPDLPTGLQIGDSVAGSAKWAEAPRIVLPWAALTSWDGNPAVWVVDPETNKVSLRRIDVLRYETERIVLADGLQDGEQVVSLGANLLFPGRRVRAVEGE